MTRLSIWLYRRLRGWIALAAVLLFFSFVGLVLPRQSAQAGEYVRDAGTPDLSMLYSADALYEMAEAYGEEGRAAYVRTRFSFDIIWPIVYTLFLLSSTNWVLERAISHSSRIRRVNLLPLLGSAFDFLENLTTSTVMLRYPSPTPVLADLAGAFTALKWLSLSISFLVLMAGLMVVIWKSFRRSTT